LSYVADAFAHAALLGVALALWMGLPPLIGVLGFAVVATLCVLWQPSLWQQTPDAVIMVAAGAAMAAGLFLMQVLGVTKGSIMSYLVGDASAPDALYVVTTLAFVLAGAWFLWRFWRELLTLSLTPRVAMAEGVPRQTLHFLFMLGVFCFVLLGLRWVGALILTLLLIAPVLTCASWVRRPGACLVAASLLGGIVFLVGCVVATQTAFSLGATVGVVWGVAVMLSRGLAWSVGKRSAQHATG
jgi:zinc transport system permease protein